MIRPLLLLVLFLLPAHAAETAAAMHAITVEIDYADGRPVRTLHTEYAQGTSALSVLQSVAEVKTRMVGPYLFVSSIDGLHSLPGRMGWFYAIDGVDAKQLAQSTLLIDAKTMRWVYKPEVCY